MVVEAVALKDILDAAIEALFNAVCLRWHREREAVREVEICAELVELILSYGRTLADAEQPVGEILAVNGQHTGDFHRRGTCPVT